VLDPFIPAHAGLDAELQAFVAFIHDTVAQLDGAS
jgi:hypothetical protein